MIYHNRIITKSQPCHTPTPQALQNSAPKTIAIEPAYDLVGEEDFDAPMMGTSRIGR